MGLFQDAFQERVIPAANRAFGISAVLTHGAVETVPFTVQWQDQEYDLISSEDFLTKFHSRDFTFDVSDASCNGVTFKPRTGDELVLTENGMSKRFEVLPVGDKPAAALLPGGYRWMVHTKRVE